MRRFALILLVAILPLAYPWSAAATEPARFSIDDPFSVVYQPCGLTEVGVFHRSFTTFFDQDGNETRTLEQVSFEGVITNSATGETFVDRGHSTVVFKTGFTTGFTLIGIVYNIHLPREGLLLLDAGRLIADADFNTVFQSAKAIDLFEIDAAVCAALGS